MTFFIVALAVLVAVVVVGYLQPRWSWTGLRDETKKPKTLWDWLGLLIIPLVIAAGGYAINQAQTTRERDTAARDEKQAKALAADQRHAETLRTYLQQMSALILDHDLADPKKRGVKLGIDESPTGALANSLTSIVLRELDRSRRGRVVQFLAEAGLIKNKGTNVIDLEHADLRGIELAYADLSDTYFSGVDLRGANLQNTEIDDADFEFADLRNADFSYAGGPPGEIVRREHHATFEYSCLTGTDFTGADLTNVSFADAQGSGTDFTDATLEGASFKDAFLEKVTDAPANLPPPQVPLAGAPPPVLCSSFDEGP
jgi:hypothetical protein